MLINAPCYQMVEEMEALARSMHGRQLPVPPSERLKAK
jgi:hypothetical protein